MQRSAQSYFKSHQGRPPNSHSEQMYGPGRTMAYRPSSCARLKNAPMSSMPLVSNTSSLGMCAFHAT